MDFTDEIRARMLITKLEAKIEVCDIERADMKRIANSRRSTSDEVMEALTKSKELVQEQKRLADELKAVQSAFSGLTR